MGNQAVSSGSANLVVEVTPGNVNQFLLLFYEVHPNAIPSFDPREVLLTLLRKSQHVWGNYWIATHQKNTWWTFKITDGQLEEILVAPGLSDHARKRLRERFGLSERLAVLAAIDISRGRSLSHEEKRKLRIVGHDCAAVQYKDRVYLIKGRSVVTVVIGR